MSDGWTTDYTGADARAATLTVWGLKPATRYNWQVLVDPAVGADYTDARIRRLTTSNLPAFLPMLTPTTWGEAPDFDHVLFHLRTTSTVDGSIIIADPDGTIRWYQHAPATGESYSASWYSAEEDAVYALVELERLVRYSMDGEKTLDWDTSGVLADPVHHTVTTHDGIIYVQVVRQSSNGVHTYAEDGIEGYDADGNLVYEWWLSDGGLDPTTNPPYMWATAGSGFDDIWPGIQDWAHGNSLQIRDEGGSLKAYLSFRVLWQTAKVDMATGAVEWLMGQNTQAASIASNDFTLDPSGVSTTWWQYQHHLHVEDDGTWLLFDNGNRRDSRGLAFEVDEGAGTVEITREVTFADLEDGDFDGRCDRVGSTVRTPSDHLVLMCGPHQLIADFDASDSLAWSMEIDTTSTVQHAQPLWGIGF